MIFFVILGEMFAALTVFLSKKNEKKIPEKKEKSGFPSPHGNGRTRKDGRTQARVRLLLFTHTQAPTHTSTCTVALTHECTHKHTHEHARMPAHKHTITRMVTLTHKCTREHKRESTRMPARMNKHAHKHAQTFHITTCTSRHARTQARARSLSLMNARTHTSQRMVAFMNECTHTQARTPGRASTRTSRHARMFACTHKHEYARI